MVVMKARNILLTAVSICAALAVTTLAQLPAARRDAQLSAEQIQSFKTELPGSRNNAKLVFRASFGPRDLEPAERRRHSRFGKIPFRLTANYSLLKTDRSNRVLSQTQTGRIEMYILDANGTMVAREAMSSEKMCPT